MTHDVFISHSSHDRDVADAACIALEQRGFGCWLAPRDVPPGRDHGEAAADAVVGSRLLLLIFSAETADSPPVRREVERAASRSLPIIAFRIADLPPSGGLDDLLGAAHWFDALTPPIAPHLDYLGDTVAELLDETLRGPLLPTMPQHPLPKRRRANNWLPIVLAGAAGVVAIALAAAYVARTMPPAAEMRNGTG